LDRDPACSSGSGRGRRKCAGGFSSLTIKVRSGNAFDSDALDNSHFSTFDFLRLVGIKFVGTDEDSFPLLFGLFLIQVQHAGSRADPRWACQ
jgi:hypothetical protein